MAKPPIPATPFYVRALRVAYKVLAIVWPSLGAQIAYKIWFRTPRYNESRREQTWRKLALSEAINIDGKKIAVYRWGAITPGYVLFIHGWSGRGVQLGGFVNSINHSGMGVISFDAPGHGFSDGNSTNLYEIANAANEIVKKYGPPKAIIAHSFGCLVSAFLIRKYYLPTEKLVTISCPKKSMYLVFAYQTYFQIPDKIMKIFHNTIHENFSKDVYLDISTDQNLKKLDIDLLMIHDKDDRIVGWEQTQSLADDLIKKEKSVETFYTNKLGHTRILRDKDVIAKAAGFITKD